MLGQSLSYSYGRWGVVSLVGVHHQLDVRADGMSQGGDSLNILVHRQAADLGFHTFEASIHVACGLF